MDGDRDRHVGGLGCFDRLLDRRPSNPEGGRSAKEGVRGGVGGLGEEDAV